MAGWVGSCKNFSGLGWVGPKILDWFGFGLKMDPRTTLNKPLFVIYAFKIKIVFVLQLGGAYNSLLFI